MNYEAHQLEEIYRLATVYSGSILRVYICRHLDFWSMGRKRARRLAVYILRSIYKCVCMCAAHLFYFLYFFLSCIIGEKMARSSSSTGGWIKRGGCIIESRKRLDKNRLRVTRLMLARLFYIYSASREIEYSSVTHAHTHTHSKKSLKRSPSCWKISRPAHAWILPSTTAAAAVIWDSHWAARHQSRV